MCGARSCYNACHEYRPHHSPHLLAADGNSHMSLYVVDAPNAADLARQQASAHQPMVGYGWIHQLIIRPTSGHQRSHLKIETFVQQLSTSYCTPQMDDGPRP